LNYLVIYVNFLGDNKGVQPVRTFWSNNGRKGLPGKSQIGIRENLLGTGMIGNDCGKVNQ